MTSALIYFAILLSSADPFRTILRKATMKAEKILRHNLMQGKDDVLNSSHAQAFGARILLGVVDSVAGDISRANLPDSVVDWGIDEVVSYVPHALVERALLNTSDSIENSETNCTLSVNPVNNGTVATMTDQNRSSDRDGLGDRNGRGGAAIRRVVTSLIMQYVPHRIPQLIAQFLHDHIHLLQFGMPPTQ
jgi:hypothetical protein